MTTVEKRPLKVFLCHAHSDKGAVFALSDRLTKDGVDVWLDKKSLLPGQEWEYEIRKAVRESDVVVVCLSKQFNQAGFRQKEVRLALDTAMEQPEGEIFIIPARLDECNALESLKRWHWVDLFDADGYEYLLRALHKRADKVGATFRSKNVWLPRIQPPQKGKAATAKKSSVDEKTTISPAQKMSEQSSSPEPNHPKKWRIEYTVAVIGAAATILAALIGVIPKFIEPVVTPMLISTVTVTLTAKPTVTKTATPDLNQIPTARFQPEPSWTPTETFTPTITPSSLSGVYDPHPVADDYHDAFGVPMRLVPAGQFTMGSEKGSAKDYADEQPAHTVSIDAFYMDKYEVTNALYKDCVEKGVCTVPYRSLDPNNTMPYDNSIYRNLPVVYVNWYQAKTYCEWRDARLPTEAEWEKTARGTNIQIYPWGKGIDCSFANFSVCIGWNANGIATTAVGSYEKGISPYKIYDMAGNVWEWVADWFDEKYYANSPLNNPQGPNIGQTRVIRGGSYYDGTDYVRVAYRGRKGPNTSLAQIGFRCARSSQ